MVDPTDFLRRTPLRRVIPGPVEWNALDDGAVAWRVGHRDTVGDLAVVDLSPLPRLGFKGRGTIPAMRTRGLTLEPEPNRAFRQPDESLCLVLGAGEVLLLGPLEGGGTSSVLERRWRIEDGEGTYPVPRGDTHAWLAVAGRAVPDLLAKLCAVDFRLNKFADLAIAQTSVARLNAIVARADRGGMPVFHLLADSASSAYLLGCLLDAAGEFGGVMVGCEALRPRDGRSNGAR